MELEVKDIIRWFELANEKMQENKLYLTALDQPIGDGDHGINMARGYQEAVARLRSKEYSEPSEVLKDASMALLSKVGGASGPLYGTAFLKMSMAVRGLETIEQEALAKGLTAAVEGMKQRGKAVEGEKTMIDVWGPVSEFVKERTISADGLAESARVAIDQTKELTATKGRAAYFKEKSKGHIDPGSASSAFIFEALSEVLREKE